MPKAHTNTKTLARLAMGTAILTVMAGCENRTANTSYNDIVAIPQTVLTPAPAETSTVTAPEYIAPGAPTYTEATRAANIQTFETVYGQPVADVASGTVVADTSYALPSYNDGSVASETLTAPATTSYAETVAATIYTDQTTTLDAPVSYSVDADVTDGMIYGETLTSSAYGVTETVLDPMPAPAMAADTYTAEAASIETGNYISTGTLTLDPMPMDATVIEAAPVKTMAIEEVMPVETVPMNAEIFSGLGALPVTDAAAPAYAPMPVETAAAPMFGSIQTETMQTATEMQIIGNEEAITTYASAPLESAASGFVAMDMPATEETAALGFEVQTAAMMPAATAIAEGTMYPQPRQKSFKVASIAPTVDNGPLTAPLPRPRPAAITASQETYASFNSPLPQPRPSYREPVAVATSAGKYVSVGNIGDWQEETSTVAAPAPVTSQKSEKPVVQEASIDTRDTVLPSATASRSMPTDLSGTSWKLVKVGDAAVEVNAELHFDDSSSFAGGQGPCNSYGGEFANAGDGTFSMGNIFATKTQCSSRDIENTYIRALEKAGRYEITPDFSQMVLKDKTGKALVEFTAF